LLAGAGEPRRSKAIALLGVRGAGKSTVGARLAKRIGARFVEVDQRIEQAAGLRLAEIFELHGEAYYRRLEREVLGQLLGEARAIVLATGGSIVNDTASYGLLRERAATVWLRARAEDHWNRVVQQGDQRPMSKNPHAFAELRALLAAREPLYSAAHHVVDTSGRSVDAVVDAVADAVG
jgi:XRE family aerobic/anaerobic benzoate catabolism transcriptional regulator